MSAAGFVAVRALASNRVHRAEGKLGEGAMSRLFGV